ncbi:MAG TPA: flagellar export chaperone FliS [Candidatus Methylacidiphilales bacterium]
MDTKLRDFYLTSQVKNAAPGQLLVMLYDCLIDQAEHAEAAIASPEILRDPYPASQSVSRCINILTELSATLRPGEYPELCATLRNLYIFFTREFSESFSKRDPQRIRAILPLIRELRGTWSEAYRRAGHAQLMVA